MSLDLPLRNNHHVYILGAGYSAARGMPLIPGFLNRMRDAAIWFEQNQMDKEKDAIQEVLRFRLSAAASAYRVPIDLENVEELFSLASASRGQIADSVKLSIAATLWYCSQVDAPHLFMGDAEVTKLGLQRASRPLNANDPSTRIVDMYDALALKLLLVDQPERSSVITFNYDTIVEDSIASLGGTFNYGFCGPPERQAGVAYDDDGLAVLKLHGSVNWSNQAGVLKVFKGYESLRETGAIPLIIPPTWNKTIQDRLSEVWATAIDRLSTATKIFIVGFSIPKTDLHFKYLLAAGMRDNFSLREIVFIDPAETTIRARATDVIASREIENNRVRFVPYRLENLIGERVHEVSGRYVPVSQRVIADALG
jgi:hypothetical protein